MDKQTGMIMDMHVGVAGNSARIELDGLKNVLQWFTMASIFLL